MQARAARHPCTNGHARQYVGGLKTTRQGPCAPQTSCTESCSRVVSLMKLAPFAGTKVLPMRSSCYEPFHTSSCRFRCKLA
eukprot:5233770-Amphidinium_carterae.1